MIGIIDYGGGNLRSVCNAIQTFGVEYRVVSDASEVDGISRLILPGQGAFGDTMHRLSERGFKDLLKDWIDADRPYFGICVGYQILFESSDEAPGVEGLGVLAGRVKKFEAEPGLKIPHMGWNMAKATRGETKVWQGLGADPYFYYVHSYYPEVKDVTAVVALSQYGTQEFAGAIEVGQCFACQFHPEKSQNSGLRLMKNFVV